VGSALLAVPLGLAVGWFRRSEMALNPLLQILRPISPLAWIPISILWFGVGDVAAIYRAILAEPPRERECGPVSALPGLALRDPRTLPQYYETRFNGSFLRQGWKRILTPWGSLVQLQSVTDSGGAGLFSTQRILVVSSEGKQRLIAVADEDLFLAEVLKRCPALEKKSFGLGLPMMPPTWL